MLRQWSYREYNYPNLTVRDSRRLMVHVSKNGGLRHLGHCIDWLRNAAMCHTDTSSLAVFKWDAGPRPMLNTHRVPHRCVGWNEMLTSHEDRMVGHEEAASLINPNLLRIPPTED